MAPRFLRPARRRRSRLPRWLLPAIAIPLAIELFLHLRSYHVAAPAVAVDEPFQYGCREPDLARADGATDEEEDDESLASGSSKTKKKATTTTASRPHRENAALVMLARNSERNAAMNTVATVHRRFNHYYRYPIVFLNDRPWDPIFVHDLNATAGGLGIFEQVPADMWGYPDWIDRDEARRQIKRQGDAGIVHAGQEGYHHMCRFYSGNFYKLPALQKYRWYWRIEPDVEFTCTISYDPFVEMAKRGKVYGYTIALWEVGSSCPSLFRHAADFLAKYERSNKGGGSSATTGSGGSLWRSAMEASPFPLPLRWLLAWLFPAHRDRSGDLWSLCHYWSNFEIADMDFFRSKQYMDFYEYLDRQGGFYSERWGDAAVHSLAVSMFAEPWQLHHFSDIGYRHADMWQCPGNAPGDAAQLPHSEALRSSVRTSVNPRFRAWSPETADGIGCRCECGDAKGGKGMERGGRSTNVHPYCLHRLKRPLEGGGTWGQWLGF